MILLPEKRQERTGDMQILGLTSNVNLKVIIGADYYDPGLYFNKVDSESIDGLRKIEFIGTHPTLSEGNWGGRRFRLWETESRPQVAQISLDGQRLLYSTNKADQIFSVNLEAKIDPEKIPDKINLEPEIVSITGPEERIEYFIEASPGLFITIENYGNSKLGVYLLKKIKLECINIVDLSKIKGLKERIDKDKTIPVDGVMEGKVNMLYGLAVVDDRLLMIPDRRSTLSKGIFSIDISSGIDKISEDSLAELIKGSESISGNGIAPVKNGLFISKYTATRDKMIGESPLFTYIPLLR